MNFEASRAKALDKLNNFVENNLSEYSKLRNFDYGPDNRSNISCLSPYITHGIINEKEVIKKSLDKFSFAKNEKFIQEVLWRTYWKGWLELRPSVWTDFLIELKKIKGDFQNNQNYKNAIDGKTNVECFNYWVNELKENNYLHNHTRMWFASIWIFTLNLPWQLGNNLIIFENNLCFETSDFQNNKFKKFYIISNKNENRCIKLSEKVLKFKSSLIQDQEQRFKNQSIDCEVIDISEIKKIEKAVGLYPTIGENLDYLNSNTFKINFLYRELDQNSWQYCNKGFFNFKNYIPKIISTLN